MLGGAKGLGTAVWKSIRNRGHLWALFSLLSFHLLANWAWLSSNVTIVGWDQPSNLLKTLIHNDLLSHFDMRNLFTLLTWQRFRPIFPFLTAVPFCRLFGTSTDVALMSNSIYVPVLLLSVYGIGEKIHGRKVGLLATFLVSTYPILFSMSRTAYVEYPLTALVALSIYLLLRSEGFRKRGYSLLLGLNLGLGMLTKWTFVAFLGVPLIWGAFSSGAMAHLRAFWRRERDSLCPSHRLLGSPLLHLLIALILTAAWYLPNRDRVWKLDLGFWLFPLSWFLLAGTLYLLSRIPGQGANLLSALALAITVAAVWYLPNIGFLDEFFFIAYGGGATDAVNVDFSYPPTYFRYLSSIASNQLSPLYFGAFLLAASILLWLRLKGSSVGEPSPHTQILVLWLIVPFLVFTFSRTMNPKHTIALLPPAALITAHGLQEVANDRLRVALLFVLIVGGLFQFFVLSYDAWAWVAERTSFNLPFVGRGNLFAQGAYLWSPNRGATDSGYWILSDVLDEAAGRGVESSRGRVRFALLIETPQINSVIFRYLAYGNYPQIVTLRFRSGKEAPSPQEQLFAADYVLSKSGANEYLGAEKQRALALVKGFPLFDVVFDLVKRYDLPNGEEVYLYKKRYYMREGYNPEDYQGIGEWLREGSREGDGIVIVPPEQVEVLGRYIEKTLEPHPLPREGASVEEMEGELVEIVSRHGRIFSVFWDEGRIEGVHLVEGWLNEHGYRAWERWYGGVRLVIYAPSFGDEAVYRPLGVRLGDKIVLDGYRLIDEEVRAGGILRLILHWRAEGEIGEEYKVFVHLLDEGGEIVAQRDSEPVGSMRPTSGWEAGEEVVDRYGVLVGEGTPSGRYGLVVGMYEPESGERLPIVDEGGVAIGDDVSLGMVEVVDE